MSDIKVENIPIYEKFLDAGYVPDFLMRKGIRYFLGNRLNEIENGQLLSNKQELKAENIKSRLNFLNEKKIEYIKHLKNVSKKPLVDSSQDKKVIALDTEKANEQHYEIPTEFFKLCLGNKLKYSGCLYENGAKNLNEAEVDMLDLYINRGAFHDGQEVLDLGCGWGSVTLYFAEKFPNSRFTSLSNSATQRQHIELVAKEKNLSNVTVITADINDFDFEKNFDRIISIEMFEHMKNYSQLFSKINKWLKPSGKLFCHVFAHKDMPYDFNAGDKNSWMAKYFFSGGTMPSADLFLFFQENLTIEDRWIVNGKNYAKTSA
ncbi:hypothetical protein HK099_003656, partial [Clydaea vesicula]